MMANAARGGAASAMNHMGLGSLVFVTAMILVVGLFWYFGRDGS